MTRPPWSLRARCQFVAAGILIAGLAAAMVLYRAAAPPPENTSDYRLEDSKHYLHQLELYGGKANILAAEFRQWFDGLWRGRSLAYTVACLSILLAFAVFIYATRLPRAEE
jgi:hypothetical protein